MVPIVDIFLILILAGFVFYGFFFGLIRTIGSLAALIIGAWVASHYYQTFYALIKPWFLGYNSFGKVLAFIILFGIASKLTSLAVSLLDKTFNIISIIPFLSSINKLGGAVFGLAEGSLAVGVGLIFIQSNALIGGMALKLLAGSKIAPVLIKIAAIITPLIPEILSKAKKFA